MAKSKNLRMGNGESLTPIVFDKQVCVVCGRKANPWGIYEHGNAIVCSRFCGAKYLDERRKKHGI